MAVTPRIRRRLWVALAAIAATLSMTGGASAASRCEAMPEGCAACCCEPEPAVTTAQAPPVHGPAVGRPVPSTIPCACCAQAPTAPASKPGQRVEVRRADPGRELATAPPREIRPRHPSAIAFLPDAGPPRSPVYLRTMHLLI